MKLGIYGCDLANAANKVSKAIANKSVSPILECIRISTDGDYAIFTATDLDIGISVRVKCEVFEQGETCVIGKTFVEYANKLTDLDYVELSSDEKQVKVKCGNFKFALSTMNTKDFPKFQEENDGCGFEISADALKEIISSTAFCCANDNSRPILRGCLFEVNGNDLNVCALDGFRMALKTCNVSNIKGSIKSVIPARSLFELIRLIDEEKTIRIVLEKGSLLLNTKDTTFTARLLSGDFIRYQDLFAAPYFTTVVVNKDTLLSSLERASIIAKSSNNIVHCIVDNNGMNLKTNSDFGLSDDTIDVEQNGNGINLYFNYHYFIDCLKAIKDETIRICFGKDNRSPFFVLPKENGDYKYLILPVRVNVSN